MEKNVPCQITFDTRQWKTFGSIGALDSAMPQINCPGFINHHRKPLLLTPRWCAGVLDDWLGHGHSCFIVDDYPTSLRQNNGPTINNLQTDGSTFCVLRAGTDRMSVLPPNSVGGHPY